MLFVSIASVIGCVWLGTHIGMFMPYYFVVDCNKILAIATALSAFLFFKNLKFKNAFINTVAASCFGVLLIHANSDVMRKWLWNDVLNNVEMYSSNLLIVHAVGSVLAIYIICTVIDYLRIRMIEKPFFRFADKYIVKIADGYMRIESKLCEKLNIKEK